MFGLVRTPQPIKLEEREQDRVRVLRRHMLAGEPHAPDACAIALALRGHFKTRYVRVGARKWNAGGWNDRWLPWRARLFVMLYDLTNGRIGRWWPSFTIKL